MDQKEIKAKTSPFDSKWWSDRRKAIFSRIVRTELRQKEASKLRREKNI